MSELLGFFKDKKVLVTGHTGFKGSWLCKILIDAGQSAKKIENALNRIRNKSCRN